MFCEVYLLDLPYHIDRPFDYSCGDDLMAGALVKVPFGRANNLRLGVVFKLKDVSEGNNIKPVHSKLDERFALTEQMLGLCSFLKEYTLCTIGEAVRCILPPGALSDKLNISYRQTVSLAVEREFAAALLTGTGRGALRSEGQRNILRYLLSVTEADSQLVRELTGVNSTHIAALKAKGYIKISESENIRNPYGFYAKERDTSKIVLSKAQLSAFEKIRELMITGKPNCALLHGVTGSGKTKVIMRAIDECMELGKCAVMMVPEIALTPQTLSIFCRRYGERVAVIHSSLSAGERMDAWRRIRRGDVDLVIGTRSAVFAPLPNVGLIVIDEEHEHTYKSESDPKYHARDVASYICGKSGALLLLASATPSLESYYKAKNGSYTLVELKERYGGVSLPDAVIVDMREELRLGNTTPISARLLKSLEEVKEEECQAILFLNRRGYNSQVSCKGCGEALGCPRCSVSLTYHTDSKSGRLMCHMCGYTQPVPRVCPECGEEKLSFLGFGTQKVEAELTKYLPDMKVMRMDADTTSGKLAYDKMLDDFRRERADILLGTQMVAKGHDFPKVTLSGVLLADTSLFVSDFRASERTFSLLTQVIGRAGRAAQGGVAVIQTYAPKNEIIRLACIQDYEKFYEGEILLRKELTYPPFCDIATLTVTSDRDIHAMGDAKRLSDILLSELEGDIGKLPFVVFGPFEAGVYKINEKYRMKLVVKCKLNSAVRKMFSRILRKFSEESKNSTLSIDFNPLSSG